MCLHVHDEGTKNEKNNIHALARPYDQENEWLSKAVEMRVIWKQNVAFKLNK